MGARALVQDSLPTKTDPAPSLVQKRWADKKARQQVIVDQIVKDAGNGPVTERQVTLIARTLHRSKDVVKEMIDQARLNLADDAVDYVDMHKMATQAALANGDAKSLEVATRASQWAMKNISMEGKHVVEQQAQASTGTVINIGVKLGGLIPQTEGLIEGAIVTVETPASLPPSPLPSKVPEESL